MERSLADLARHLRTQRQTTLETWRLAVKADPTLGTARSLPRALLYDHVPGLLNAYERQLELVDSGSAADLLAANQQSVAHALHRWQQGYDLREVSRELGLLNEAVVAQLDVYARERPHVDFEVMATARRIWAQVSSVESSRSIAEHFRLQQVEAAGHISDLEQALAEIRELERERANLWHEAAHDLRGNLSVVMAATAGLHRTGAREKDQERILQVIDRNAASLHHLLNDVTDLARLQAGRETRRVETFDVAASLIELSDGLQSQADRTLLFLRCEGPSPFVVEGDKVKVGRLVQNLVLNALKYTKRGGVTIRWGDSAADDSKRWTLSVQDTGPGFAGGPGAPLAGALVQATEAKEHTSAGTADVAGNVSTPPQETPAPHPASVRQEQGEGIGLSIVKRLAELLDATVELESGTIGTTFRVLLPRRYQT